MTFNTLETKGLTNNRKDGNSTRQINAVISNIFDENCKEIIIIDHAINHKDPDISSGLNDRILDVVKNRLQNEHRISLESIFNVATIKGLNNRIILRRKG